MMDKNWYSWSDTLDYLGFTTPQLISAIHDGLPIYDYSKSIRYYKKDFLETESKKYSSPHLIRWKVDINNGEKLIVRNHSIDYYSLQNNKKKQVNKLGIITNNGHQYICDTEFGLFMLDQNTGEWRFARNNYINYPVQLSSIIETLNMSMYKSFECLCNSFFQNIGINSTQALFELACAVDITFSYIVVNHNDEEIRGGGIGILLKSNTQEAQNYMENPYPMRLADGISMKFSQNGDIFEIPAYEALQDVWNLYGISSHDWLFQIPYGYRLNLYLEANNLTNQSKIYVLSENCNVKNLIIDDYYLNIIAHTLNFMFSDIYAINRKINICSSNMNLEFDENFYKKLTDNNNRNMLEKYINAFKSIENNLHKLHKNDVKLIVLKLSGFSHKKVMEELYQDKQIKKNEYNKPKVDYITKRIDSIKKYFKKETGIVLSLPENFSEYQNNPNDFLSKLDDKTIDTIANYKG